MAGLDPNVVRLPLFTVGHSTHPLDGFLGLLARHGIEALADIRRFPGSRKHPHFNRDNLASALPQAGVEYRWFEALGGRRKGSGDSARNLGLRNESFRSYADYMATEAFAEGLDRVVNLASGLRTSILCAEALWWRCHRGLIADVLQWLQFEVIHILGPGSTAPHPYTAAARFVRGRLSYSAAGAA